MNKRGSNKQHNFDGLDPQKSLMKSLESIKSLLKQGDSKISAARENIARADNSMSSDSLENRLEKKSKKQPIEKTANIKNTKIEVATSTKTSDAFEVSLDFEIPGTLEEIIVKELPDQNIFKSKSTPVVKHNLDSNKPIDNGPLNDLYDHDLIVPMLDEVVEPEDDESSLFNMDSSSEIKLDSILEVNDIHLSFDDEADADINKSNADIISFELGSNAIKNNQKTVENISIDDPALEIPKSQNSILFIEDSQVDIKTDSPTNLTTKPVKDQVVIKETTLKKSQIAETKTDLTPAIASASYTNEVLSNLASAENESKTVKQNTSSKSFVKDTDFSKIAGLDTLEINSKIMNDLQNRVEKRVHNRLIQLIVQLDEEIQDILTDEIKLCITQKTNTKNND